MNKEEEKNYMMDKLFNRSGKCRNFNRMVYCDSLSKLMAGVGDERSMGYLDIKTKAYFIANGMCTKTYSKILRNLYIDTVGRYIEKHPPFKSLKEAFLYQTMLKRLYSPNHIETNYKIFLKDNREGLPKIVFDIMNGWVSEKLAFKIAYNFSIGLLKRSDIGKCIIIYSNPLDKIKGSNKDEYEAIKSLSIDKGFNVEELL